MKINESNPVLKPHIAVSNANGNASGSQQAARTSSELTTVSLSSTSELENLLSQSADVRDSLVADIKLRLAAGEFASDQAVYKTAESILNL
jgi:anti-sigma28 factor (negative regulator of flagellin synthesis)